MRDNYMMNYPLGLVPTGEVVEAKREGIYEPLKPKPLRGPHVGFRDTKKENFKRISLYFTYPHFVNVIDRADRFGSSQRHYF